MTTTLGRADLRLLHAVVTHNTPLWNERERLALSDRLARMIEECGPPAIRFELPLHLVSLANEHGHWRSRQKRAKDHRSVVRLRMGAAILAAGAHGSVYRRVRMTRLAPRRLDSDNAVIACKEVRDAVAQALGVDDRSDWVTWECAQEKASGYGVRIELWATK